MTYYAQSSKDAAYLQKRVEELSQELEKVKSVVYNAKEILTLEEAAMFLGISRSTLYKMTHAQTIPFFKPNNKMVYFERAELLTWVRQHHVLADEQAEKLGKQRLQEIAEKS